MEHLFFNELTDCACLFFCITSVNRDAMHRISVIVIHLQRRAIHRISVAVVHLQRQVIHFVTLWKLLLLN